MTISSSTNKVLLNGDGSTTTFTFNFALLKSDYSDLYVYQIDVDEDTQEETQTLLTAGVDYNISVLKDTNLNILGGSITTTFVPTINQKIFIVREENLLQETKIEINQKFPERVIELTLDKLTLISQQQQSLLDKSLKISQTSDAVISNFADTPVENMGVVWKKNENGEFYLSNTKDNPDTVYNDIVNNPNVIAVSSNIDNINAVANNSTNIDAVAGNFTNINAVASNIANVNSVSENISNVNSVATNSTNINSVAGDLTNINNVANDLSNVDIVANNISTIQEKVNLDGSNATLSDLSDTAKENLLKLIIPNRTSQAEEHDLPWTATDYGFISFANNNSGTLTQLLINGNTTSLANKLYVDFQCLVRKGDVLSVSSGGATKVKFWACGN